MTANEPDGGKLDTKPLTDYHNFGRQLACVVSNINELAVPKLPYSYRMIRCKRGMNTAVYPDQWRAAVPVYG
jgi:hypothetical protein